MFQDVADMLNQVDPAKLNSMLSALAQGLRGHGQTIGQTITDTNQVLRAVNPRADHSGRRARLQGIQRRLQRRRPDILTTLDAASTISTTITDNAASLDALLPASSASPTVVSACSVRIRPT